MKYVYVIHLKKQNRRIYVIAHNWKEARNIAKKITGEFIKDMKWLWCDYSKLERAINRGVII